MPTPLSSVSAMFWNCARRTPVEANSGGCCAPAGYWVECVTCQRYVLVPRRRLERASSGSSSGALCPKLSCSARPWALVQKRVRGARGMEVTMENGSLIFSRPTESPHSVLSRVTLRRCPSDCSSCFQILVEDIEPRRRLSKGRDGRASVW